MLDPRIELANLIFELREKLNRVEMKLWEIPHHAEPVETYDAVYSAPAEGDYMHPMTPTHHKPEGFSDMAYWDECYQCWMEPTPYEWDEHNYCGNTNCDLSYSMESNEWIEGEDWSNDYASYLEADVHVEEHHEEVHHEEVHHEEPAPVVEEHVEPAPVELEVVMPDDAQAPVDAEPVEFVESPETAPAPEMAPEVAPVEEPNENPEG